MKVFCDTSFLVGYYDNKDQYHQESTSIIQSLSAKKPQFLITDYIYDESITHLLTTHPYYGFLRTRILDDDVIVKQKYNLIFITDQLFHKAREIFQRYNKDKKWSFTDCTSYVVMKDFGIRKVLTFDDNFSQMGFKAVK